MAVIKKKTRKPIAKQMRKLVERHGEEVVTGLVSAAVSAAAAIFATDTSEKPKKRKKHMREKVRSVAV
jgi:hypothetical protein